MGLNEVVLVDAVRTPFGKAGGVYANTRSDDLAVACVKALVERNALDPKQIEEVGIAATTQSGDQGLTLGRSVALLAGIPNTVPGYAIDRMCAGAMTAVTQVASEIAVGAIDIGIAGGVEHMGRHTLGSNMDVNPRFLAERLVAADALNMGVTAENLHDRFPTLTKQRADAYAMGSQKKTAAAYVDQRFAAQLVPVAARDAEGGWTYVTVDEPPRPDTNMDVLATLRTPFRPNGRVTAGNASGINDGATAALLMRESKARELGMRPRARMLAYAFAQHDQNCECVLQCSSHQTRCECGSRSCDAFRKMHHQSVDVVLESAADDDEQFWMLGGQHIHQGVHFGNVVRLHDGEHDRGCLVDRNRPGPCLKRNVRTEVQRCKSNSACRRRERERTDLVIAAGG